MRQMPGSKSNSMGEPSLTEGSVMLRSQHLSALVARRMSRSDASRSSAAPPSTEWDEQSQ
jgi:hypothetical protein